MPWAGYESRTGNESPLSALLPIPVSQGTLGALKFKNVARIIQQQTVTHRTWMAGVTLNQVLSPSLERGLRGSSCQVVES